MIKELKSETFIQEIEGAEQEIRYDQLEVKNGFVHLPLLGNKLEVLNLNNADDIQSIRVAKVFAKIASLK